MPATLAHPASPRVTRLAFLPCRSYPAAHQPMNPVLDQHRHSLAAQCQRFGVQRLEVFGSAARGDFDAAKSDFDFIVSFTDRTPAPTQIATWILRKPWSGCSVARSICSPSAAFAPPISGARSKPCARSSMTNEARKYFGSEAYFVVGHLL